MISQEIEQPCDLAFLFRNALMVDGSRMLVEKISGIQQGELPLHNLSVDAPLGTVKMLLPFTIKAPGASTHFASIF